MPNINNQYLYRSPFNFLDPFTRDDEQIFFGRDDEIDDVFLLFEKTNLVVLYGPSGSGKSSVAQCGLVNRFFDWKPIEIRRNQNIIDSFFDAIEIKIDKDSSTAKGLFTNKECKTIRSIFDRLSIRKNDVNYTQENEKDLKELGHIIDKLHANLSVVPFFIFDQFEELFIENKDTAEIENFSLLLSLITTRISYANVVICIQTEFFSNLVKLEGRNPNILNYKCEINDPNEINIRKIIRGTFEKFNINQIKDGTNEPLLDEEKEKRIDEIILRLKKVGSHLPFVQIYLDKLYVLDFVDTYVNEKELLKTPKEINPINYPLEFRVEEIKKYGHIREILENYIASVNTFVIDKNNKIGHVGYEHAVVKLLKHFITDNNTRRSIAVESITTKDNEDSKYYVIQGDLKNKIIKSIWGNNRTDVDKSIGDIIDELLKARILKYQNGLLEFSHNFLVGVVKNISVDEDIMEYYKRQFNSSFETYMISEKSNKELLSSQQVNNLKGKIDEILQKKEETEEDEASVNKKNYWKKSRKRVKIRKFLIMSSYVVLILSFSAIIFNIYDSYKNELRNRIIAEEEINSDRIHFNDSITKAADLGLNDLTKSYKLFANTVKRIKSYNDPGLNKDEFSFGMKMEENLIQNYLFNPFYLKKIELLTGDGKRERIITTKSRKLNDEEYILFALTSDKLYSTTFKLNNLAHPNNWTSISEGYGSISSFEPYGAGEDTRVLFSNEKGLHDVGYNLTDFKEISTQENAKKLTDLDHIKDNFFIALNGKEIVTIIDKKLDRVKIPDSLKFSGLKLIGDGTRFFVLGETNTDVIILQNNASNQSLEILAAIDKSENPKIEQDLKGFKISSNRKQILFEDDRQVYSINIDELDDISTKQKNISTKVNTFHNQSINSIDTYGDYILIGSNDKTATLFHDPNPNAEGDEVLSKIFMGHTDAIHNVSFLGEDHVITSSEDGTICVWDISPAEVKKYDCSKEKAQIGLKFNNDNLYVSSYVYKKGYLLKLNSSLTEYEKLFSNYKDVSRYIFGFNSKDDQELFIGLHENKKIFEFDKDAKNKDDLLALGAINFNGTNTHSFILDLSVVDSKIVVGTNDGVYYLSNYEDTNKNYKQLTGTEGDWINTVNFHRDGKVAVATSDKSIIYFCNLEDNSCIPMPNGHTDKVKDALFSPDGNYMISGSWDNKVFVWKFDKSNNTFKEPVIIASHNNDIEDIDVKDNINDSNLIIIASASSDKTVQLHSINKSTDEIKRLTSIIRHDRSLRSVTFGENSNVIYSADSKGYIKKWDCSKFNEIIEDRTAQ